LVESAGARRAPSAAGRIDAAFSASAFRSIMPESSLVADASAWGARSSPVFVSIANEKRTEFSFRWPVALTTSPA
jgi:hypothetical protein